MKINFKKTLVVTALALSSGLFAVSSQATAINATMGMALGLDSYTTSGGVNVGNIAGSTSIKFHDIYDGQPSSATFPASFLVTNIPSVAFSSANDFFSNTSITTASGLTTSYGLIGDSSYSLSIMTGALPINNFMTWGGPNSLTGGGIWQFNVTSEQVLASVPTTLDTYLLGIFHDTSGAFTDSAASLHITANQVNGGAISASATWASPPETINVPEPYFMSLLGLGLAAFGFSRRRSLLVSEGQSV
jgi:hypothetical protein